MSKPRTSPAFSIPSGFLILVLFILFFVAGTAAAKETGKDAQPKEKVVVYYFKNATKSGDYGYYSYIIADSIASEIKNTGSYEVNTIPVTLEYVESDVSANLFIRRLEFLSDRGREFDAEYVIHGTYHIENQTIYIKTQVFDVREKKVKDIKETSREIGAVLLIVIDKISEKINNELRERSKKIRPKVAAAQSPFMPCYRSLEGTTVGYIHGTGTIHGKWGDLYDKTDFSSFYLSHRFPDLGDMPYSRWVSDAYMVFMYQFFSAASTDSSNRTNLQVKAFSLNYSYPLRLSPQFSLALTAGPGLAFSTLKVETDAGMGPPEIIGSKDSTDLFLNLSAGGVFNLHPLQISTGVSFSRIFYMDRPLNASSVFFGIGFTL